MKPKTRRPDVTPVPGTHQEQTVKKIDERHPYGSVQPTDKRSDHYERHERTPKPPVESPPRGAATRRGTKRDS